MPRVDRFDLARRLLHIDPPRTLSSSSPDRQVGQRATFWLEEPSGPSAYSTGATLRYKGEHSLVYLQDRAQVADAAIQHVGETFDSRIYPQVTAEIGPPPTPPIDGDSHITILLANLQGLGGYFTEIDQEPESIERTSNQRAMIYLDVASAQPGSVAFDGYVAHELQHLLHYARRPGAQAWINEGMSELVRSQFTNSLLNIPSYEDHPDTQLNDWPTVGEGSSLPYYGAAESFLRYLLQHYGGMEQVGALAGEAGDGIAQVRAYLSQGQFGVGFEDVFADWLAANLINDPAGGRFSQNDPAIGVHDIASLKVPSMTEATVHQFGARYYAIDLAERPVSIDFDAPPAVDAIPTTAPDGAAMWWSKRGDSIDATLTRAFDLTHVDHARLQFATWYDIERDYDFGYLEVSTDSGSSWQPLETPHTSSRNPLGIAMGPAYSGESGGQDTPAWISEDMDLSAYAGKRILLRFEYVTDESANRNGWAVADVRIPEIRFDDPNASDPGWMAQGFTRLDQPFDQRFILQAVVTGSETGVQRVALDARNHGSLSLPSGMRRVVLIVSGTTDLIRTPANFRIEVRPA